MARIAVNRSRSFWRRGTALIACLSAIALGSQSAQAATPSVGRALLSTLEESFDLIVLRSTGMLSLAMGSVFFAATAPLVAPHSAINGSTEGLRGSFDVFVYPPYEYTFLRELGEF